MIQSKRYKFNSNWKNSLPKKRKEKLNLKVQRNQTINFERGVEVQHNNKRDQEAAGEFQNRHLNSNKKYKILPH